MGGAESEVLFPGGGKPKPSAAKVPGRGMFGREAWMVRRSGSWIRVEIGSGEEALWGRQFEAARAA